MNIPLPSTPNVIKEEKNFGVYEIEGLYPGYGVTLGNALRRVLLSSIPGAAVTSVKIAGIKHEFSTVPGVKEDVLDLLLNLKRLRFKLLNNEPVEIKLKKIGKEGMVTGADFELPGGVELMNPKEHIATITDKKAHFEVIVRVEPGIGFVVAEEIHGRKKAEVDTMVVDAVYAPVQRVNFKVENMRVGDRTDFNRIVLEIETDGTIAPREALVQASKLLIDHLVIIQGIKQETVTEELVKNEGSIDLSKLKVAELNLLEHYKDLLVKSGIKTFGALTKKTRKDLLAIEGVDEGGVDEIKKALTNVGLSLKGE